MDVCPTCSHEVVERDFWPGPGGHLSNRFQCMVCGHKAMVCMLRKCDTCFWKKTPCQICIVRAELGPRACATLTCVNSNASTCWICLGTYCKACIGVGILSGNPVCKTCTLKDKRPIAPTGPPEVETREPVYAWGEVEMAPKISALDRVIHRTTGYKPLSTKED